MLHGPVAKLPTAAMNRIFHKLKSNIFKANPSSMHSYFHNSHIHYHMTKLLFKILLLGRRQTVTFQISISPFFPSLLLITTVKLLITHICKLSLKSDHYRIVSKQFWFSFLGKSDIVDSQIQNMIGRNPVAQVYLLPPVPTTTGLASYAGS